MTRENAIDRIVRDLGTPPGLRPFIEREVDRLANYPATLDVETVKVIETIIRREANT